MASTTNGDSTPSLWAITSYFNPMRYRRRLVNYRLFRQQISLPLVTVELSFGADFELGTGDADLVVQLREGDVMWQKERLLNVALSALPAACRKVVWLDCDLLIGGTEWPECVSRALDYFPVVQPFSRVCYLRPDATGADLHDSRASEFWRNSLMSGILTGEPFRDCLRASNDRAPGSCAPGHAWAARRELLDRHGLYDACIIGGGDAAYACAVYGCFDELERRQFMNDQERDSYRAWAQPFHADVGRAASWVDNPIFHLWHGSIPDRRTRERYERLRPFQFDPNCDVAVAASGAWRWNSDKPALHQYVRDYFAARKDDG